MNGQALNIKDSFRVVGINVSSVLTLHGHVVDLAIVANCDFCSEYSSIFQEPIRQQYTKQQ